MKRREAIGMLGAMTVGLGGPSGFRPSVVGRQAEEPRLAPGAPTSPERLALIESFKSRSAGIEDLFEARTHQADWTMPYRLFRPKAAGPMPLVVYLHGSGGLGDDNKKQMGLGNVFGTRLWALLDTQRRFPCYVAVPQTDRGWVRYGPPDPASNVAKPIAGLGDGARLALEIIDELVGEFPLDRRRIYLTGQSMGGAGVWHFLAQRPSLFAAAAICCGSESTDDAAVARGTPLWNFHGDADQTVPPAVSRGRIAALRAAGGRPLATEYPGVGHNVWEWAFTEPALLPWLFGQRRAG